METIQGKFVNSVLYINGGYSYNKDKRSKATYRCAQRRNTLCRGMAIENDNGEVVIITQHDHLPDDLLIRKYELKREMLHLCRTTCRTTKDIFNEISRQNPTVAEHMSFKSMKSQLNTERKKYRPKTVTSIEELIQGLEENPSLCAFYKTSVVASDGNRAIVFSHANMVAALDTAKEIYCDGTFSIIPRSPRFSQFYTVHIRYMDKMIAVLYILCEARTLALYDALWTEIIERVPAIQYNIEFIMTDYEWAAMSALKKHFPSAKIKGCWFHFNQAVQRKWNHLCVDKVYNIVLSMTMSIPLLPEEFIGDAYCILQNYLEKLGPTDEKLIQFLSYIERTWLRKTAIVSVYGIPVRTNNAVESYNRIISRKLGSHPNIWVFLEKLEHLIMDQQIDLQRLYNGHKIQSTRLKKHIDRDRKIKDAQASLISGRLPLEQFLQMFLDICREYQYRYCLDEQSDDGVDENKDRSSPDLRCTSESKVLLKRLSDTKIAQWTKSRRSSKKVQDTDKTS